MCFSGQCIINKESKKFCVSSIWNLLVIFNANISRGHTVIYKLNKMFNFGFHPLCFSISITLIIQSNTTEYHVRPSNSEVTIRSMRRHVSVVCRPSSGLQELTYVNCNATILKNFKTMGSHLCGYYNCQLK
jgi:hypothetical protein